MSAVNDVVAKYIRQICDEGGKAHPVIEDKLSLMEDIGLSSLEFATLISFLETDFGVDPFLDGSIAATDMRTVGEICHVYEMAIQKKV